MVALDLLFDECGEVGLSMVVDGDYISASDRAIVYQPIYLGFNPFLWEIGGADHQPDGAMLWPSCLDDGKDTIIFHVHSLPMIWCTIAVGKVISIVIRQLLVSTTEVGSSTG